MNVLLAILVVGLGTYFCRAVFIIALANRRIPPVVRLAMEHVGPAVMAALVVSMLLGPTGELAAGPAEALALAGAAVVAWKTRNHLLTLAVAMAALWLARGLLGS
jgi:branched-subunit amino acid transport protein